MISMSELSDAWKEIIPQAGQSVGRRADKNHPLDFFITYDENQNMQMMLCGTAETIEKWLLNEHKTIEK